MKFLQSVRSSVSLSVLTVLTLMATLAPPRAAAQQYRLYTLPNIYTSVSAGVNTNGVGFDNSNGGTANTAFRLPKSLSAGAMFQASFQCATVTLAASSFVIQGSIDGTNFNNAPASAIVATVAATAASANNTNVVFTSAITAANLQQFQWIRLAGITNGNAADMTSITTQIGYWE